MNRFIRNFVAARIGKGMVEATFNDDGSATLKVDYSFIKSEPGRTVILQVAAYAIRSLDLKEAELSYRLCRLAIAQTQKRLVQSSPVEGVASNLDLTVIPWNGDLTEVPYGGATVGCIGLFAQSQQSVSDISADA